jgi:hypothetical protein
MAVAFGRGRIAFATLFALMVAGSVNWRLLQLPFIDRELLRAQVSSIPDRSTPDYPRFLAEVRARTASRDTIAVLVPRGWSSGYEYAFQRANYFLAGRTIVPLIDNRDVPHPERLSTVRYVAAWSMPFDSPRFVIIWRGHNGVLVRRR